MGFLIRSLTLALSRREREFLCSTPNFVPNSIGLLLSRERGFLVSMRTHPLRGINFPTTIISFFGADRKPFVPVYPRTLMLQ